MKLVPVCGTLLNEPTDIAAPLGEFIGLSEFQSVAKVGKPGKALGSVGDLKPTID